MSKEVSQEFLDTVSRPNLERAIAYLYSAFTWCKSPQGQDYWSEVIDNLNLIDDAAEQAELEAEAKDNKCANTDS